LDRADEPPPGLPLKVVYNQSACHYLAATRYPHHFVRRYSVVDPTDGGAEEGDEPGAVPMEGPSPRSLLESEFESKCSIMFESKCFGVTK